MPVPKHIFAPPFNIVRSSHITLGVTDLGRSRAFYEGTLGLQVEDETGDALYLRGLEERQHHSLVLRRSAVPSARHLGLQGRERGRPRQGRAPLQDAGHAARLRRGTLPGPHAARARSRAGCRSSSISRWTNASPCSASTAATRACSRSGSTISMCSHRRCSAPSTSMPRSASASPSTPRRTAPTGASRRPGCIARATCTTSPSPTAPARGCITSPTGCRPRSTSSTCAT